MEKVGDIETRSDIEKLVNRFYDKVKEDDLIAFFFRDIVPVDWPKHLPRMYDFWESIILGTGNYKGEPMTAHINLNKLHPMEDQHFHRWVSLFQKTVDENFAGSKAEEVKKRAETIAGIMMWKVR
jgi:hemoglobin